MTNVPIAESLSIRSRIRIVKFFTESHFGRTIVNAGWLGSAIPLTMPAGILKTALLARMLGISDYGTYGLILSFTGMLTLIFGFSSAEATITYSNRALETNNRQQAVEIIRYCLVFDLLLSLLTYLSLVLASSFFPGWFHLDASAKTSLLVYGLSVIGNATHWVARGLLHLCDCFRYDFFYNVAYSWVSLACFASLYLFGGGLLAVVAIEAALAWVFGVILLIITFKVLHGNGLYLKMAQKAWWRVPREVWRYQILGYFRASVKGVHRHMAVLVLGYITSPAEVGIFNAATRLTDPLRNGTQIFVSSLYPRYSKLWFSNKPEELKCLFNQSAILFATLSTCVLVTFWPFMHKIVQFLFGADFVAATGPAVVLLLAVAILIVAAPLNALLPAIGRNRPPLFSALIMMVAQVGFLLVLVPPYGPSGAAWAFVLAIVMGNLYLMPQTLLAMRKKGSTSKGVRGKLED